MKAPFSKLLAGPLVVLALSSFAMAPLADAAGRGGGGGGGARGGGGGVVNAGGGGARQNTQVDNSRADVRTNNVRSTSVNNVNVNRNVDVNVDRGCCDRGWDNDYPPVATAAAVTATVAVTSAVIGSMVRTVPAGCVPVNYGGIVYQQCGATWYQPRSEERRVGKEGGARG